MRKIFLLVMLLVGVSFGAFRDSTTQAGAWSTASSWAHGVVPGKTDSAVIKHRITTSTGDSIHHCVIAIDSLIISGIFNVADTLRVGDGLNRDGKLVLNAGSLLNVVVAIQQNNCAINSRGTNANPVKVTGAYRLMKGLRYSQPKLDWQTTYTSFLGTGAFKVYPGGDNGTVTNQIKISNCYFSGMPSCTLGSVNAASTYPFIVDSSSFVDITTVVMQGPGATMVPQSDHRVFANTFYGITKTSRMGFKSFNSIEISYNNFYNSTIGTTVTNSSGNMYLHHNFIASPDTNDCVFSFPNDTTPARFYNNYAWQNSENAHSFPFGSPRGGTTNIIGNIIQEDHYRTSSGGNFLILTTCTTAVNVQKNIMIGEGNFACIVGTRKPTAGRITLSNNTASFASKSTDNQFWLSESNLDSSGLLTIYNNAIKYDSISTAKSIATTASGKIQVIDYTNYNSFFNVDTLYGSVAFPLNVNANDKKNTDPFWEAARPNLTGMLEYGKYKTGSYLTYKNVIDSFLISNGMDLTSQTQTGTKSKGRFNVCDILGRTRTLYKPKNIALKGSGRFGSDIGAVPFLVSRKDTITGLNFGVVDSISSELCYNDTTGGYRDSASVKLIVSGVNDKSGTYTACDSSSLLKGGAIDTLYKNKTGLTTGWYFYKLAAKSSFQTGNILDTSVVDSFYYNAPASGPTISAQPQNVTKCIGESASFSVTATGIGTLHYQWTRQGSNVGTDASAYAFTVAGANNGDTVKVSVTDDVGTTVSSKATLTVTQLPSFTYATNPASYTFGSAITANTITSTGGTITSFSGSVPAGLSLNTSTGAITGTPTAEQVQTGHTITATNCSGTSQTVIQITVSCAAFGALSYASNPSTGVVSVAYSNAFTIASGTLDSVTLATALPAGLSLTKTGAQIGLISGPPTTQQGATVTTVNAWKCGAIKSTVNITITINAAPPAKVGPLSYASSPAICSTGTFYSFPITNAGGAADSFKITGTLPTGLTFSQVSGLIIGTVTQVKSKAGYKVVGYNITGNDSTYDTITVYQSITPITSIDTIKSCYPKIIRADNNSTVAQRTITVKVKQGFTYACSNNTEIWLHSINLGKSYSHTDSSVTDTVPTSLSGGFYRVHLRDISQNPFSDTLLNAVRLLKPSATITNP